LWKAELSLCHLPTKAITVDTDPSSLKTVSCSLIPQSQSHTVPTSSMEYSFHILQLTMVYQGRGQGTSNSKH